MSQDNDDVILHNGKWCHLDDVAHYLEYDETEEMHALAEEDAQATWDAWAELHPERADWAVGLVPEARPTYAQFFEACPDVVEWDYAGGVARFDDGVTCWYAPEADVRGVLEMRPPKSSTEDDFYTDFCDAVESGIDSCDEDALPLMARYAHARYDLRTEDGREEALRHVFGNDPDELADACMLLDAIDENVKLTTTDPEKS